MFQLQATCDELQGWKMSGVSDVKDESDVSDVIDESGVSDFNRLQGRM
jgi:hypothetical protein